MAHDFDIVVIGGVQETPLAQSIQRQVPRARDQTGRTDFARIAVMGAKAALAVKLPRPPLSDLIDHIDHMVKVAGVDHVGLGSDFDGIDCSPQGIDSVADLPKITEALYQRGYKAADIQKILGGNLMRVFAEVEKAAKLLQAEDAAGNKDTRTEITPEAAPK